MADGKLEKVLTMEQSRERKAAGSMQRSQMQNRQLDEQLSQLQQYRQEYENLFREAATQGIDARILEDYRRFLAKLNEAIERQHEQVGSAREQYQQSRTRWTRTWQRKTALSQLIDRNKLAETLRRDKSGQKEADERSGSASTPD